MQHYAQYNRQFEADLFTIGCFAGLLRMVIAIYRDLPLAVVNLDFIVDCSLLIIFIVPLILLRLKVQFEWITVPFSFLVIGFLCANWIVLDGLRGTGEYYFIGGIILIALIHTGKWLYFFVTLCVVLQAGLVYFENKYPEQMNYGNPEDLGFYHYLWITLVVTLALIYHKNQFEEKRRSLRDKKQNLENKIVTLERQNVQLEDQKQMLEESNAWLEKNIALRSEKLLTQRHSIEKYLSVTLFEMGPYLDSTLQAINQLNATTKKTQMGDLLLRSADHLQSAVGAVTSKIKKGIYYNPDN